MKAVLVKTEKGLRGSTESDHTAWLKFKRRLITMKPGTWLRFEWAVPRNGPHHRKLFALLALITENSEVYQSTEQALVAVKLVTAHVEVVTHPVTGEIIQVPKSIAYESMDQDTFDAWYSSAIDGVLKYILPQLDRDKADQLLDLIISGWA